MELFLDSTLTDAINAGCDCVQYKHDGSWAKFFIKNGVVTVQHRYLAAPKEIGSTHDKSIDCILVGAYRDVTNRPWVFDCWQVRNEAGEMVDIRKERYRSRYVAARIQCKLVNDGLLPIVVSYPIAHAEQMWSRIATHTDGDIKGLVFRNSRDPAGVPLRCARWYAEMPRGLT